MIGIVIKNGKLPPNCWDCKYESNHVPDCPCWNGTADASDYRQSRHPFCPIKELPEHGRLGDLDLMKENFAESLRITRQQVDLDSDSPFYGLQQRDLANAEKLVNGLIDRTPTVLEASESTTERKDGVVSKKALLDAFDNYGCPKERNTYLFKALRKLVEDANEL